MFHDLQIHIASTRTGPKAHTHLGALMMERIDRGWYGSYSRKVLFKESKIELIFNIIKYEEE